MDNTTAWICVAGMAIVAIVALALVLNNKPVAAPSQEVGVEYIYDAQNKLTGITPAGSAVRLRPLG